MTISSAQCRAARAMLDWSQQELSTRSGVGIVTLRNFENGASTPYPRTLRDIREAFEAVSIVFTNGDQPGLYLRSAQAAIGNGEHQPAPAQASPRPRGRKTDGAGTVVAA